MESVPLSAARAGRRGGSCLLLALVLLAVTARTVSAQVVNQSSIFQALLRLEVRCCRCQELVAEYEVCAEPAATTWPLSACTSHSAVAS